MNKIFKSAMFFAAAVTLGLTSCGSDDDNNNSAPTPAAVTDPQNLEYTSELAAAWGNYAVNVAKLLEDDATNLYNEWNNNYAQKFKNADASIGFDSYDACVEQMIDGCIDIANEVGAAKIGEPVDYWNAGDRTKALYAVESWYSWHSRDDYKNNILSIANALVGKCLTEAEFRSYASYDNLKNAINSSNLPENSIMGIEGIGADKTWQKIVAAWEAIDNIPQPFRNNIGSNEAAKAMDACAELNNSLAEMKSYIATLDDDDLKSIVQQFVDNVVLPTYNNLVAKNKALLNAVRAFQANPSDATFASACEAWLAARQPWETSEAFLFGPVSDMGLDPNMDSWPLDAAGIYELLKSQQWSEMQWSGDYDEEDEAIEAAQALRGYHTLEYLLFKDGQPRKVNN
jgi:predicted lipoprotein